MANSVGCVVVAAASRMADAGLRRTYRSYRQPRPAGFEFTVGDVPSVRRRRADGGRTVAGTFTVQ